MIATIRVSEVRITSTQVSVQADRPEHLVRVLELVRCMIAQSVACGDGHSNLACFLTKRADVLCEHVCKGQPGASFMVHQASGMEDDGACVLVVPQHDEQLDHVAHQA